MKNFALLLATASTLVADPILQDVWNNNFQVEHWSPIGQSFTAGDPYIASLGVGVLPKNPQNTYGTLTFSLFAGEGFGGGLLGTAIVDPGLDFSGWVDAGFNGIALNVGQRYTFQVAASNASPYWGLNINTTDVYGGGTAFTNGSPIAGDLQFRVTPGVQPPPVDAVPETSSFLLMGLASLGLLGIRSRRV